MLSAAALPRWQIKACGRFKAISNASTDATAVCSIILPIWAGLAKAQFCHKSQLDRSHHLADASSRWIDTVFMALRQKIVAIVEDDPSMLRAARDLLDAYGFATVVFSSAEEFLARGGDRDVDCVLLDIDLAGMSGIDLRRQLKLTASALPIIFMTALDDEAIEQQALKAGCVAFLRKPFSQGALIDAIKRAVP